MPDIGGKELRVTPASLGVAFQLKKAISDAILKAGVKLNLGEFLGKISDLEKLDTNDVGNIGWVLEIALSVSTDENVREVLFKCGEKSVHGESKVTKEYFEPIENRQFYFPIMIELIKANLSPFFKFLNLGSLTSFLAKSKDQR